MTNLTAFGHITKDAVLRTVKVGGVDVSVCDFHIASNDNGDDEPQFIKATIWRQYAEKMAPYLLKGRAVILNGPVKAGVWTSSQDHKLHPQMEMRSPQIQFAGKRPEALEDDDAPFAEVTPE